MQDQCLDFGCTKLYLKIMLITQRNLNSLCYPGDPSFRSNYNKAWQLIDVITLFTCRVYMLAQIISQELKIPLQTSSTY